MMKRFTQHLAFATLADYAEGRLEEPQRADAEEHLAACDECRTALAGVQRTVAALRGNELKAAPPYAIARALHLFRPLVQPAPAKAERRSLLGFLHFDSGVTPALGMRSGIAGHKAARQLLFNFDEYDLDVRLEASGDEWLVAGQFLGGEGSGTAALIGGDQSYRSELNELGEFSFAAIPPGVYQLLIALPAVDLSLPDLRVGE